MTPETGALLISGGGFLLSVGTSIFITGFRSGTLAARLDALERTVDKNASKEQLAALKEDVAEIKGMFRMTLRDGTGGP